MFEITSPLCVFGGTQGKQPVAKCEGLISESVQNAGSFVLVFIRVSFSVCLFWFWKNLHFVHTSLRLIFHNRNMLPVQ